MPWLKTCTTNNQAQLGLPDKGFAIKGFVAYISGGLEPFKLPEQSGS